MNSLIEKLHAASKLLNLSLTSVAQDQLLAYITLLQKWNHAYNLIGTNNSEEILISHVLDSLSIANAIEGQHILDVGTGAGLPGIPLAIIMPEKKFTLVDSIGKKIRFLTQAIVELQLKNVSAIQTRIEHFTSPYCFNIIMSRAVTSAAEMITLAEHLLCPNGKMLMMKGRIPTEELQEIAWHYQVLPLNVPYLNKERHLVVLKRNNH